MDVVVGVAQWDQPVAGSHLVGHVVGDMVFGQRPPNPANPGPNGGSWRSNVLAFSEDNDLEDGLSFSNMATDDKGYALSLIHI